MPEAVSTAFMIGGGLQALGAIVNGVVGGKISREQARLQARQLGLQEEQLDFMIAQAERGNRVAEHNVGQVSPMLQAMVGRQEGIMSQSPEYTRLEPPSVNNPYGAGGQFGNSAPPPIAGIPGLSYGGEGPQAAPPEAAPSGAGIERALGHANRVVGQVPGGPQPQAGIVEGEFGQAGAPGLDPRALARKMAGRHLLGGAG